MKKIGVSILTLTLLLGALTVTAHAAPAVSARSSILVEAGTGAVLYEDNASEEKLIASTTKIMTALVVLEHCRDDDEVVVKPECVGVEGSSMYLRQGEKLTVRELLYGLLLASGNDAAEALAYHTAGSLAKFADMMNEKARELGCTHSRFANPHGLNQDGHYSSARDLAVIAAAAIKNDTFRQITATKYIDVAGRSLKNHNKLLWNYDGVIGVKTGYTKNAGRCLVSCAERDGLRLICVTLSDPNDWEDHMALFDWGFESFKLVQIDCRSYELPVISGKRDSVTVKTSEGFSLLVSRDEKIDVSVTLPRFVYAPVQAGALEGSVAIKRNGELVKLLPLRCEGGAALDESILLTKWEQLVRSLPFVRWG